jgi:hypothetical protein
MILRERRSGIDTRSDAEKQLIGERRSGIERRSGCEPAKVMPSNEQLALLHGALEGRYAMKKVATFLE